MAKAAKKSPAVDEKQKHLDEIKQMVEVLSMKDLISLFPNKEKRKALRGMPKDQKGQERARQYIMSMYQGRESTAIISSMDDRLSELKNNLLEYFSDIAGRSMTPADIEALSVGETLDVLLKYQHGEKDGGEEENALNLPLLKLQYQWNGITLSEEKEKVIRQVFDIPEEELSEKPDPKPIEKDAAAESDEESEDDEEEYDPSDWDAALEYQNEFVDNLIKENADKISARVEQLMSDIPARMTEARFFDLLSNAMMEEGAAYREKQKLEEVKKAVGEQQKLSLSRQSGEKLKKHLVDAVQMARPSYQTNDIVNLLTCTMQGFLTVLAGKPGCGKTSICNILAKVLGLTRADSHRYVMVSVERGWTTKGDLIGYYNPLTKSFEASNEDVFTAFQQLDEEARKNIYAMPYLIALDEANLSPMEYYWADFMNVCDDPGDNHTINMGNGHTLQIPETLHFLATINNDDTTTSLSPRLLDRAWIVTLPELNGTALLQDTGKLQEDEVKPVSWEAIKATFQAGKDIGLDKDQNDIYQELVKQLGKMELSISARSQIALMKYCKAASGLMEKEGDAEPNIVALDYAIAQKVLPQISGSGEKFGKELEKFGEICGDQNLERSQKLIEKMVKRGNERMNFYQFFD